MGSRTRGSGGSGKVVKRVRIGQTWLRLTGGEKYRQKLVLVGVEREVFKKVVVVVVVVVKGRFILSVVKWETA